MAEHLVCHDEGARGSHEGERRECRNRDCNGDQGDQHDRPDRPPSEDPAGRSEQKRDVPEQIQRGTAAQRDRGHRVEVLADVADRRL